MRTHPAASTRRTVGFVLTRRQAGFTLIELVMVIVVTAALAVFAVPKMPDVTSFRLRGYADELRAQALSAQRLALAQRRPIVATFNTTGVSFAYASGGGMVATVNCPAAASPCISEAGPRTMTFNADNTGAAVSSSGAALPVTLSAGGSSFTYQMEADTGLFRPLP